MLEVEAVNTSVKGKITVKKQDVDTGDFLPQGDAKLDGAVYGLYAKEDIQKPDGTGVLYKAGSLIQEKTFGKSGEIVFENVYLGAMYVKEIRLHQKDTFWTEWNMMQRLFMKDRKNRL